MGIFREAAAAAIEGARSGKRGGVTAQSGETPGQESLDRAAGGDSGDTSGFGQAAGRALKRIGKRMITKQRN